MVNKIINKIYELQSSGKSDDEIISEGTDFLRGLVKDLSWDEKQKFFLSVEREEKLR